MSSDWKHFSSIQIIFFAYEIYVFALFAYSAYYSKKMFL